MTTTNYLLASYLQSSECGNLEIQKVERLSIGRARFSFAISDEEAERLKMKFHKSVCSEFERLRKSTIALAYG